MMENQQRRDKGEAWGKGPRLSPEMAEYIESTVEDISKSKNKCTFYTHTNIKVLYSRS